MICALSLCNAGIVTGFKNRTGESAYTRHSPSLQEELLTESCLLQWQPTFIDWRKCNAECSLVALLGSALLGGITGTDRPQTVFYALIGNDVCNHVSPELFASFCSDCSDCVRAFRCCLLLLFACCCDSATIVVSARLLTIQLTGCVSLCKRPAQRHSHDTMTKPAEFERNALAALDYLDRERLCLANSRSEHSLCSLLGNSSHGAWLACHLHSARRWPRPLGEKRVPLPFIPSFKLWTS